ncbi:5416_t:CDS:2 [Entrophospora sp. SA101]|nr:5416_t:CDS:2 [Entrophospora sp. SA101]
MSLSERWRLLVTGEERIDKIIGIAELAYSVQPLYEVVRQAKKIESNIFEASNSKENYASTMDQLILNMKELIEDKTKIHLEQLATKSILDSMDKRIKQIKEETEMKGRSINIDNINYIINNENDEEDVKRIKEILQIEERLLKESSSSYSSTSTSDTNHEIHSSSSSSKPPNSLSSIAPDAPAISTNI